MNKVPLDWASTQNNLGNALSVLGERERAPNLVCEALQSELDAWQAFVAGGDTYEASRAANDGQSVISLLTSKFKETSNSCINEHAAAIQNMKAWNDQQHSSLDLNAVAL